MRKITALLLVFTLVLAMSATAFASSFTDAHGNVIELDDTLEAYTGNTLLGADNAARKAETNLGDLWTDALLWFAQSGKIASAYDEDDIALGNDKIQVENDMIVALWNGGNLRADIKEGKFGAAQLAQVLPYPNKVAVIYMTGAQLTEALEAASQGLPFSSESLDSTAAFMQVAGLKYTVDVTKAYDKGEAFGKSWFKANSLGRVTITEVNGKTFDSEATYAVITHNANYNGMDSGYVFKEAVAANENSTITTAVVRDVVWQFISEELKNQVGSKYAQPQGRITVTGNPFDDVKAGEYYAQAVAYAYENGITDGTAQRSFSPAASLTRAQAVTFLYRAAGSPAVEAENPFTDVKEGDYFYNAVLWAFKNGITDGVSETSFAPNATCTRAQAVTFLCRAKAGSSAAATPFKDVESGEWYTEAVAWAFANGITDGVSADSFGVNQTVTRAQMVSFIYRAK